ncbi:NAD-dependent succinate-semialdehyde dehydrogenase [Bosea sp. (in: a-proteobacteria)]|uniref:NAD-dependent succinate-semialdehyde dehydrogenase n=1 Tax=Bosea sp. (in: a-proteobacteria) TaxID=1871050 RepID=UPI002611C350|nr:NAD-dependent succinate-semialdehyde dehydrogenase [Bosea sp. (in: a-proteobacteria)]MCO5092937.1 NAD-dependent succinate-semialdehyde dehydrogenase [Bosea sp. (in: a-proteobacteria)]
MHATATVLPEFERDNPPAGVPRQLLIGGIWRDAAEMSRFKVIDPATGAAVAEVADASIEDAIAAVDAAAAAAECWAETAPRRRAELLMSIFEAILAQHERLAQLISLENGKSIADARGEVSYAAEFFRWYAEEAVRAHGSLGLAPTGANRLLVDHRPIGISVLVTPWNFPAAMATRKIAPALAAGCTCILKPAAETPLTALALAEIMRQAGVPAGVVNVVATTRAGPVVSAMLHDPRVRKLSFTGSTSVGRLLLREAADQVISCSMELGGNAAFIVFDDADLDAAVEGAMIAKMRNGGEACTAANRFFAERGIHDAFVDRLAERMGSLRVGPGRDEATQCGPLITVAAVEKVGRLVADAVSAGARVVTQAAAPAWPYYYPPTVMAEVPSSAAILREEIFGPVAAVVPFDGEDEVVALANDTEYGLVGYVYTGDFKRGLRVAGRLESGMVGLNRGLVSDPAAPFGGVKQSGLGREGGSHGLLEFLETQYIAASW